MASRIPVIAYWQSSDSQWRWHLKATNGEIVASGEGYVTKAGAIRGANALKRNALLAVIRHKTEK